MSCSPFRVPIARLAAAQAVLAGHTAARARRRRGQGRRPRPDEGARGRPAEGRPEARAKRAAVSAPSRSRGSGHGRAGPGRGTVHPMCIPDEDVARVRAATDIVALIGEHAALKRGARGGWGCARSTARSRRRSASTPRRASTTASAARPRATPSASSGPWSTSTSSTPCAGWPTRPASPSTRTARRPGQPEAQGRPGRHGAGHRVVPPAAADRRPTPARPGTTCAVRGYDGEVVRRFRLGWAPDGWDALCTALELCEEVLSGAGLGFVNKRGRLQDAFRARVLFPICDPSGNPVALGGPDPARGGQRPGRSTRTPRDADLLEAPDPLRPQLGQARHHRLGRGGRLRGLHRRDRLLRGGSAPGRGHLRHGPGRGALQAAEATSPPASCWPSTPTVPAVGRRPVLRVGAPARGRRGRGRPAAGLRSRPTWPGRDPDALREAVPGPRRSSSSGSTGSWVGRPDHARGPGPGCRPRARPRWPSTPTTSSATST